MNDRTEPMNEFETRLARGTRALSEAAIQPIDAVELARQAMSARRQEIGLLGRQGVSRRVVLALLAAVATLAAVVAMALVAGRTALPDRLLVVSGGEIQALDPRSGSVVGLGSGAFPVWSPTRDRVAFQLNGGLWVMDADGSGRHRTSAPGWSGLPEWSPDGRWILGTEVTTPESVEFGLVGADGGDNRLLGVEPWKDSGNGTWAPDGSSVVVVTATGVLKLPVGNPTGDSTVLRGRADNPWLVRWSPLGTSIAYNVAAGIHLMDMDGRNDRLLVEVPPYAHELEWAPDGRTLAYTEQTADTVTTVDPATGTTVSVYRAEVGRHPVGLAWSPDGHELGVETVDVLAEPTDDADLWIIDVVHGTARRVAEHLHWDPMGQLDW